MQRHRWARSNDRMAGRVDSILVLAGLDGGLASWNEGPVVRHPTHSTLRISARQTRCSPQQKSTLALRKRLERSAGSTIRDGAFPAWAESLSEEAWISRLNTTSCVPSSLKTSRQACGLRVFLARSFTPSSICLRAIGWPWNAALNVSAQRPMSTRPMRH